MNILMLGPWLPTTRRPLANERLHQFARHLAKDHRLTLACATDHPNPIGAVSALREQFDDLEFAVVPNRWKRLLSVAHLAVDLRLAQNHRVEPARDAEQMRYGIAVTAHVSVTRGVAAEPR